MIFIINNLCTELGFCCRHKINLMNSSLCLVICYMQPCNNTLSQLVKRYYLFKLYISSASQVITSMALANYCSMWLGVSQCVRMRTNVNKIYLA